MTKEEILSNKYIKRFLRHNHLHNDALELKTSLCSSIIRERTKCDGCKGFEHCKQCNRGLRPSLAFQNGAIYEELEQCKYVNKTRTTSDDIKNRKSFKKGEYSGFIVPSFAITKYDLKGTELLLYSLIYSFTNDSKRKNSYKASQKKIASTLKISEKRVSELIFTLKQKGLIEVEKSHFSFKTTYQVNRYRALVPEPITIKEFKHIRANDGFVVEYDMLDDELTSSQVLIASRIRSWCQKGKTVCYASHAALAEWCGCSAKTVERALKVLLEKEIIIDYNGIYVDAVLYAADVLDSKMSDSVTEFDQTVEHSLINANLISFSGDAKDKMLCKYLKKNSSRYNNICNFLLLLKKKHTVFNNRLVDYRKQLTYRLSSVRKSNFISSLSLDFDRSIVDLCKFEKIYSSMLRHLEVNCDCSYYESLSIVLNAFNTLNRGVNLVFRDNHHLLDRVAIVNCLDNEDYLKKWFEIIVRKEFYDIDISDRYVKKIIYNDITNHRKALDELLTV